MKDPFDYQVEDAARLADPDDPSTGLASDPGTGKTFTSLIAAKNIEAERILVFCPAVARPVWEVETNDTRWWVPVRIDGKREKPDELPLLSVLIVSYEHFVASPAIRDYVKAHGPYDLMICDEGHYLKNPSAKRTFYIYEDVVRLAERVWPLSGTFMLNHPGELWPHLNALDPSRIDNQNYFQFTRRYCSFQQKRIAGGKMVEMITGAEPSRREELRQRMMGMFIRRKADVSNLPPLNFRMLPLEIADCDTAALRTLGGMDEEVEYVRHALDRIIAGGNVGDLETLGLHMARLRSVLAAAKAPAIAKVARDILDNSSQKLILWGWHKTALEHLHHEMRDYGVHMIKGDTSPKNREVAVDQFQNNPESRVFVGQIQAAGTAITLTAATRELFLEQAFTPALNFQAAKRAHRIGQTLSVLVQTGYLPGTIDEAVIGLLNGKLVDIRAMEGAV